MDTFVVVVLVLLSLLAVAGFFMQQAEKNQKTNLLDQLNNLPDFHPEKTLINTRAHIHDYSNRKSTS